MHGNPASERPAALVVEYDHWQRTCASQALSGAGVHVVGASNGASGLRLANRQPFDVILLGVHLPEVDSSQVLRHLRAAPATCNVPVVVIGDAANVGFEEAQGVLLKPLEDARVVEEVARVLVRHAAPRESGAQLSLSDAGTAAPCMPRGDAHRRSRAAVATPAVI
jgi:two-component system copper resistance phosphate regulon response regulator CusR